MGIFTPSPAINYSFVTGVYLFCTVLCAILSIMHHYTPQVEGFYIVLVPFVPCFFWSVVVRHNWLKVKDCSVDADEAKKTL
ncbi:hypothetical protein CCR75_005528 [Bremia lactucae]|uniref:Uncharacterized protein n=1 Tax=Bremia lactucae TaxID=4779 RepID=A0A976FPI9_BRELC|nr:hypothetical protein CCR75_005528 [Bremia lactucae]